MLSTRWVKNEGILVTDSENLDIPILLHRLGPSIVHPQKRIKGATWLGTISLNSL